MTSPDLFYLAAFPLVGAAIGWTTNFLAIKMLFHPRRPIGLPGFAVQGLLPRRRKDLAEKIAGTVADEILSTGEISSLLGRIHWREEVEGIVHSLIIRDVIPKPLRKLPGIEIILIQIKDALTERILEALDEHRDAIVSRFHDELDIRGMVLDRISSFDMDQLEELVFRLVARELRHIEMTGGVLGFAVGSFQSLVLYFGLR